MIAGGCFLAVYALIAWVFKPLCENVKGGGFIVALIILVGSILAGMGLNELTDVLDKHDKKHADINVICKKIIPDVMYTRPGRYIYFYQLVPKEIREKYSISFILINNDEDVAEKLFTLGQFKIHTKKVGECDVVFREAYNHTTKTMKLIIN